MTTTFLVLHYLAKHGPSSAGHVGASVMDDRRKGRITSASGGGDYAMQMLLGRMNKTGLVQHAPDERRGGCTLWMLTAKGAALAKS